jgi:translation elongation factor P/translation initiation factor 5A
MKKQAKDLAKGNKITIADQLCNVQEIEISDIGKHGKRKVRIQASASSGEKIVIIRPEDCPFEVSE